MTTVAVQIDRRGIAAIEPGPMKRAVVAALRKAGATALRDMRAEAVKRIKSRKRIAAKYISRALSLRKSQGADIAGMSWAVLVSGAPVPLIAYPHRAKKRPTMGKRRQGPRDIGGVIVEVNPGKKTLIRGAFVATMGSGHEGIFKRVSSARLPIKELLGSRPVDALLHDGEAEAVAARGTSSFGATFSRVLPLEIGK